MKRPTAASSPAKTASPARVALFLLLIFGALELFTRFQLVNASKDLRRFKTYPQRAAQLHAASPLRVAILGNSAAERGLDPLVLKRDLAARNVAVSLDFFTADASHVNSWQPMANHLFWAPRQAPDVLVVPYFGTSLEDQNRIEIGRLAQFFTTWREFRRNNSEMPDTASRLDFAVSSVWATYATRERLKERVLKVIVPDFQNFTLALHDANQPTKTGTQIRTWKHLEQLARDARANRCRLIFVALPWRDRAYPIEPTLRTRLRNAGAELLDLRAASGLKSTFYADSIHLTPQGRAVFTPQMARALAPLLRPMEREN